ncbi:MAG: 16S rRNA (uracil(1498)-N(3))-methyltransferase [Candidatus Kapabacteria bacterium]|nr:16S rRNA (uracil(1498)-N(3))-methyltransferase [Candidatus Kapabacteria bacterium]
MECLYINKILNVGEICELNTDESKHARALRLREGDNIYLTNGIGSLYLSELVSYSKNSLNCRILESYPNFGEPDKYVHAFIALIDNKDRIDFCIEKCIEIGVSEFTFLNTRYSTKRQINPDRLQAKAIATIKQCKRAMLPKFNPTIDIAKIDSVIGDYDVYLADENGQSFKSFNLKSRVALIVGPEGGFSEEEISMLQNLDKASLVNLGNRRLRAETAAIAMSILCLNL